MSVWIQHIGWMVMSQAGEPAAEALEAASATEVQSVWDFVLKGGVMMIPIGLCSLVALAVFVERLISLRRKKVVPPGFLPGLMKELNGDQSNPKKALDYCRKNGSPVASVFAAGLKHLNGSIEFVERQISETGRREAVKLRKHLRVLSVIAAIAPLMGLLGTILGMITAFQTVATSADALGRTELLAEGIYQAMITTAAGLAVAIPSLIFYHWLSAKVQKLIMDIDQMTVEFVEEIANGAGAAGHEARPALARGESDGVIATI
ncbi:MAG: MotA/TolQ/ExbB proton channel family protein [Phycisphaerales bacterium]|nr:MAG: MotA/TolQ/ExbB proton channel family protein [Phycisphaerales bacterium]